MKVMNKRWGRAKGFTLTELLIGALVIGLGLVGLIYLYNRYTQADAVNTMVRMSVERNATVKNATGGAPNYGAANLNLAVHRNNGYDPTFYRVTVAGTTATVSNKWGGASVITGNNNNFTWSEASVPAVVCTGWLPKLTREAWTSVTVNGGAALPVPITAADAAANCSTDSTILLTSNN